jgi:spermidine synthase
MISAALLGIGLSGSVVDAIFSGPSAVLSYMLVVGGILCPLAWLLGQTVPILANLLRAERSGEAAGRALYWSTLGSFLGSVSLSLGMMQAFGVWSAVLLGAVLLVAGALLAQPPKAVLSVSAGFAVLISAASLFLNLEDRQRAATAHADYSVMNVGREDNPGRRAFIVNNQTASIIDDNSPPRYAAYIEHLRYILHEDLRFSDRDILVLGAGGFTLSHREPAAIRNRYTYVDIDPAIRKLAEQHFLREPATGTFVVGDARRYVVDTTNRYDAVVVDVYSALTSIPGHLVTREFWRDTRRAIKPGGVLLVNLLLDGKLASPYARNLLATIESAYGRCSVDVPSKSAAVTNVIVSCFPADETPPARIYVDERNLADLDSARSQ